MSVSIIFLVHGDPTDILNYSGIPYHLLPALTGATNRLGVPFSVVETFDLLNVQEILQYIASLRVSDVLAPELTASQKGQEVNIELLARVRAAETESEIGSAVRKYYDSVAKIVQQRVGSTSGRRLLSQNYFYPFTGSLPNVSYYLDANLTDFFFNETTGVVDHSWRLPVLTDMYQQIEREALRAADIVFCFSRSLGRSLQAIPGLIDLQTVVIGAGPAFHTLPTAAPRRQHSTGPLLFVGLDFDRKGGDILVRTMDTLWKRHRLYLRAVTRSEFHVQVPGVEFLDPCTKQQLGDLYRSSSIFVFPTLSEPFGLVVCEAMAYGLPVVATQVGAVPEIVGKAGRPFLADIGPPAEMAVVLAEKIETLMTDGDLRATVGAQGRARIAAIYNWDTVADRLVRLLGAIPRNDIIDGGDIYTSMGDDGYNDIL